jgi:hypothetical protein
LTAAPLAVAIGGLELVVTVVLLTGATTEVEVVEATAAEVVEATAAEVEEVVRAAATVEAEAEPAGADDVAGGAPGTERVTPFWRQSDVATARVSVHIG